ncbi:Erg28 like protein [Hordeum vulgare]|nr:Erg28 like protein [Hordeum vulgare]
MVNLLRRRPWQEEAMAVLSSAAACPAAQSGVPLLDALGLVLAEDVRAPSPLPPFRAAIAAPVLPRRVSAMANAVTEIHDRTIGVWTLLTCTLCFLCAFNLENKPLEYLIYHTIAAANLSTAGFFTEGEAFAYAAKTGMDVVAILPSLVLGPLMQPIVNASSKILLKYLKGKVHGGRLSFGVFHWTAPLLPATLFGIGTVSSSPSSAPCLLSPVALMILVAFEPRSWCGSMAIVPWLSG